MNFSLSKKSYIFLFFIIYLIIFSKGTIAGDYEKIFNISQKFINSDLSLLDFIKSYSNPKFLEFPNENNFFKHNFVFFLVNILVIKLFNFLPNFSLLTYILEYTLALIPGLLFTLSIFIIYNSYKKKFNVNLLIISIIFFWFGTYIINFFSSSAFAESYTFFLLSVRFYLIEKNKKNFVIPIIDALLIQIRITCFFLIPIFLYSYFKNKKKDFRNLFIYFAPFIITIILFRNILSPIEIDSYYFEKIVASFCTSNFVEIISTYSNRLFQTFFSFSLGIIFTFPIIIIIFLSFFKSFNFEDLLKILSLMALIFLFALEEYWFLPAGISGNRGIAPFLLFLFPNFILGLKSIFNKHHVKIIAAISLSLLIFLPSLYYRTTIATYAVCGNIQGCTMPFRELNLKDPKRKITEFKEKKIKCRVDNLFAMYDFKMHPSLFSYNIILNKLFGNKTTKVHLIEKKFFEIDTSYIIPETLGAKIMFLLNNKLILIDPKKNKFKDYIINYKKLIYTTIVVLKIISFILLFLILYKNYKKYLQKII